MGTLCVVQTLNQHSDMESLGKIRHVTTKDVIFTLLKLLWTLQISQ